MAVEDIEGRKWEARIKLYELLKSLVPIFYILAFYLPIKAVQPVAESFAGKHTNVTLTVSITLALSLALGAGFLAQMKKSRDQRKELQRLRRRITMLENELEGQVQ